MAVAAILVAVAVPNMRTFIQNGRLNTQVNDLIGDIVFARSAAIHSAGTPPSGAGVGICQSINGTTCVVGNWQNGRAVFTDLNNDNDWDAGEPIIRFREPLPSVNTLAVNGLMPTVISFNVSTSSTSKPNVTNVNGGVFVFCDERGQAYGKQVSLNAMGHPIVSAIPPPTCTPL